VLSLRSAATILGPAALLGALLGVEAVALADPPAPRAAPPASAPDKEQRQKLAMALHDEAWALYEQGRYHAAIEKLEAALRIDPEGKELVYNLALLHEKLADVPQAEAYYRRYLDMETDPKARSRAQATLRRLEGMEKEVAAAAPRPPAPPPPPPPPPRPVRPWVVATGSVAGVAFLMGSIFGLNALAKNPGRSPSTGPGVTIEDLQNDARTAHADATVADVSFLVMLAAAGTATFLYFSTPRAPSPDGGPESSPTPPGSVPGKTAASVAVGPGLVRVSF
jgi:tetratricopeptide (TPR) repeat protein